MKRRLHTQLNQLVPSIANRVRNKQSQHKAAHDYHAKEREILEGQAVYARDIRNKKAWISGTVVEKTGPVSARIQLDDGTVIRRHQDHVKSRKNDMAEESATSVPPNVTPVVLEGMQNHPLLMLTTNLRFPSLHRQHLLRHLLKQVHRGHALCGEGPDLDT